MTSNTCSDADPSLVKQIVSVQDICYLIADPRFLLGSVYFTTIYLSYVENFACTIK